MENIWEESFKVRTFDVNINNRIKLNSLINFIQEAAANHATHLKVGRNHLIKENLFWVLSRAKIEIDRYPDLGEEITVRTWPKGIDRLFFLRDLEILDSENNIIANVTTSWLVVDSVKILPQRPSIIRDRFDDYREKEAIKEKLNKISDVENKELCFEKIVKYTDLDVNNHMNNVKYVEQVLNCFSESFYKKYDITELQINFLKQCKYGDNIEVYKKEIEKNKFHVEAFKKGEKKPVFKSRIKID
ncbi:MAG: hypothetical protein FXF47_02815 [Candidatus Mcinerneyibacterium aminivorans]|uniref:Acyl-ACP thioesterase n=1 Tax=Candidatus Mcinerneyibacterium aminivorans TaxID=2703815 RepID=A0A5D0MJ40_9BACT|nr:MAG: hypothetical protein FXF47_02815 [Candidatus Mcinerneyibacterium aminivorans]